MQLAPGTYSVTAEPAPQVGRGLEPSTVQVITGRPHKVDFTIDTGIR